MEEIIQQVVENPVAVAIAGFAVAGKKVEKGGNKFLWKKQIERKIRGLESIIIKIFL